MAERCRRSSNFTNTDSHKIQLVRRETDGRVRDDDGCEIILF